MGVQIQEGFLVLGHFFEKIKHAIICLFLKTYNLMDHSKANIENLSLWNEPHFLPRIIPNKILVSHFLSLCLLTCTLVASVGSVVL